MQKIIISSSLIFVACFLAGSPAFAQGIELTNIQTSPSQVHVGDSFRINATIVNNSPDTINFNGGCQSPLSATFDKNVAVGQAMGCFAIFNAELKSGQNTTVVGPASANSYTATSSGITNANVTFAYYTANKTENTISTIFIFDISERTPIPEFPLGSVLIITIVVIFGIVFTKSKKLPHLSF
ncbi:MAG: hypothetical protein KGI25_04905 [Thaumarchaeota archaeon]|nr:hypothetical protein [Nitrososphaerota archaeon]